MRFATLFLVILTLGIARDSHVSAKADIVSLDLGKAKALRPGDVIFVTLPGTFWAELASTWSLPRYRHGHVGMVIGSGRSGVVVADASGNPQLQDARIIAVPLRRFVLDAERADVFRPVNPSAAAVAASEARRYVKDRLPFDTRFDLDTPRKLYCTEMVWRALSAGYRVDILPVKSTVAGRKAILLSDLETSHYLSPIVSLVAREAAAR